MRISSPARFARTILFVAMMGATSEVFASAITPMFGVTDLGTSYQLQADSTGFAHGVTGAGGSTYAFDKSPTVSIYEKDYSSFLELHPGGFDVYLLQNGPLKSGYFTENIAWRNNGMVSNPDVPLGIPITGSWHNEVSPPISDMNAHGQIVGTSDLSLYVRSGTYAAFSAPTGGTHDINGTSSIVDNLNNYIASSLGINLTASLKIDDLGRIIAQGTVGGQTHDFLLTPNGISSDPVPTPEPSTLALLTLGTIGFAVRRRFRR